MASDTTFGSLWKRLLVHAPSLPIPLAQEFVNTAYSRILADRHWSALRVNDDFFYPTPYTTGTISLTQGSATVTGSSTVWTSAMVGRQLVVGSTAPYYDIIAVDTGAQTLTLDRPYDADNVSGSAYIIAYVYILMPSDFQTMLVVRDPSLNWRLRINISQRLLDTWDAKRTSSGTGWVLAPATPSPVTATLGRERYELWPRPSASKLFTFTYLKRPPLMSANSDEPVWPVRGDAVREGALAELALWPGVDKSTPNPYFELNAHRLHERRFLERVNEMALQDEDFLHTAIQYASEESLPWAPIDAAFIQTHDIF